jgi:putative ABC transport system permease protein
MFGNHLKIAFRSLRKRKGSSLLHILGLTIGMASCLLIFHYVSYEKSYDEHITRAEDIYRLRLDNYVKGKLEWRSATVFPAIGPALKRDYPEIENCCRLIDAHMLFVDESNQSKFTETQGYFAEQSAVSMLDMQLISGNPATALTGPDKIIISESMARKYFGDNRVLGRQLISKDRNDSRAREITGVFKDYPSNSHLDIEYLLSFDSFKAAIRRSGDTTDVTETLFDWYDFYTYLQFKPGTDVEKIESQFPAFCEKYMEQDHGNKTYSELHLIPVQDIHLHSNYNQEAEANANGQMVSLLFLIGIIVIGIAWINYINLSTARSVERAKEVGIKKVVGAVRTDLIRQFLVESMLLNLISLAFSVILFFLLLRPFDHFCGREAYTGISLSMNYLIVFIVILLVGTLLSGIYPAFVLSGFQPIKVLKGAFKNSSRGVALRKGLIIVQFTLSVVLIAGTLIIYEQVSFMRHKTIGASIDQTLILNGASSLKDSIYKSRLQPFKTELLQYRSIKGISASSEVIGTEVYWVNNAKRVEASDKESISIYVLAIDYDFVSLYDMKIKAGEDLFKEYCAGKKRGTLINETAARMLGYKNPEEAINKKLVTSGTDTILIAGVLADYHHQGLQKAIDPMLFPMGTGVRNFFSLKFSSPDMAANIKTVEAVWKKHFPDDPFDYRFLDESFNAQYKTDILFGKVFGLFALLAILIACSGLLGLSAYNVIQRSKEIGVRKVLGASTQHILILLSKDFIILIVISLVLAVPSGWYMMNLWLMDFAYHVDISWWVFALAGSLALLTALVTILLNAWKKVSENPVKSLRTE